MKKKLTKKRNRIIFFIVLDILTLAFCSYFALALRFDFFGISEVFLRNVYNYIPLDIIAFLLLFLFFKLYASMWSYASIIELLNIGFACTSYELFELFYKTLLDINMPRSYYPLKWLLLLFFVAFFRYSYRIVRTIRENARNKHADVNTMIVGAGEAGRLLINEIHINQSQFSNRVLCVIDDDANKIKSYIMGIPIVGGRTSIKEECKKRDIKEIIIAIPSASKEEIAKIVEECQKTDCKIKTLPNVYEMIDQPTMKSLRPLSYEDFLGRGEIVIDTEDISYSIKDKVVLVTGGGGSIGSELCRQIAKFEPTQLIIFDIYENNAYDIQQELIRNYPELNLETIIGSVRDYDRMEVVFKKYKPELVFHAAAHKHVPLMEDSPNEAIKNNCFGTLNVVKLADLYQVKKFVLISSDKAVRPTNIMGATKRICEMIVQTYNKKSKTDFVAVRFGNVLGSNGSVIPLFLKQIDAGGPVTVTDKNITRFFMTIPEAVSLILQAETYAEGGEIFVLDMGQPVKIYELAKKIIRFKGYEPNVDMKIKITGLRPGEKLYEELLMEEEGLKDTPNKLIHIGHPIQFDEEKFLSKLEKLIEDSYKNQDDIKDKVLSIVDNYTIDRREKNEK